MVKDDTILLLGAVGLGGYFLYKSDFFKGLSGVTGGAGEVAQDIGQVTSNIADFLNPLGASGNWVSALIQASQERYLRESQQAGFVDIQAFNQAAGQLSKIQASDEIFKAQEKSERLRETEETKTYFTQAGTTALKILTASPITAIASILKSPSVSKNLRTTSSSGAASSFAASSVSSTGNAGVKSIRVWTPQTSVLNSLGTSTAQKQAATPIITPKKKSIFEIIKESALSGIRVLRR
jgi:hypothetical protein